MGFNDLQRAAFLGVLALMAIGLTGFISTKIIKTVTSDASAESFYNPVNGIPSRSDCINDGLRAISGANFTRQTAYDIEVKCEQIIQSMEGHARTARK